MNVTTGAECSGSNNTWRSFDSRVYSSMLPTVFTYLKPSTAAGAARRIENENNRARHTNDRFIIKERWAGKLAQGRAQPTGEKPRKAKSLPGDILPTRIGPTVETVFVMARMRDLFRSWRVNCPPWARQLGLARE